MSPRNPNDAIKEGFLLDEFSQADLRRWKILSRAFDGYHIGLFYHLEGLRHLVLVQVGRLQIFK